MEDLNHDLCNDEIKFPAISIQPFGALICISKKDFVIRAVSKNLSEFLNLESNQVINKNIQNIIINFSEILENFQNSSEVQSHPISTKLNGKDVVISLSWTENCILRSKTKHHAEYTRNMGTRATLVISIIVANNLWRLVILRNLSPKYTPPEIREICSIFTDAIQLAIQAKTEIQSYEVELEHSKSIIIIKNLRSSPLLKKCNCNYFSFWSKFVFHSVK